MPLDFICGFEGISAGADLTSGGVRFHYAGLGGAAVSIVTTAGTFRTGLRALSVGAEVNRKAMVNAATRVVGFGFHHASADAFPASDSPIIVLTDGGVIGESIQNNQGLAQVSLALTSTGALCVYRGFTTAKVGSNSSNLLTRGQYYFIEFVSTIDDAGTAEVWVDGVQWLSVSGDTKNTANAYSNGLCIRGPQNAQTWYCDDVYVWRDSVTRFGPSFRVAGLMPSGGNSATNDQWNKSTGTDASAVLDEIGPNITDWVSSGTVGHKTTVPMTAVGLTGTVVGVKTYLHVSKTDAGARSICPVQRVGGIDYDGTTIVLAQGFVQSAELRETHPAGGAYTVADLDGMELGAKVVA